MVKTIGLFLEQATNPYVQQIYAEAQAEAAQHGLEIEASFADNRFLQIQQLYSAIHRSEKKRPIAIALMPAREGSLGRVANAALSRGMDWICLHRRTGELETLARRYPKNAATCIAPDSVEIGRLQGRLATAFASRGRILYVHGTNDTPSAQQRMHGFTQGVDPRVEIAGVVDGNWTTEDARSAIGRWLHTSTAADFVLDLVVAQNDAMAVGARMALRQAAGALGRPELAKVPVIGCDGLAEVGQRLVDERELAATVVLQGLGTRAVRVVAERLRGTVARPEVILPAAAYPAILDVPLTLEGSAVAAWNTEAALTA